MDNQPTHTVKFEPATKVTITISRNQMWLNFAKTMTDIDTAREFGADNINEVVNTLLSEKRLCFLETEIVKLFRDGWLMVLVGHEAANNFYENRYHKNDFILTEVIVEDIVKPGGDVDKLVIEHKDIYL